MCVFEITWLESGVASYQEGSEIERKLKDTEREHCEHGEGSGIRAVKSANSLTTVRSCPDPEGNSHRA